MSLTALSLKYSTQEKTTASPGQAFHISSSEVAAAFSAKRGTQDALSAKTGARFDGYVFGNITLRRTVGKQLARPT
tara:strand:- start:120 stop:347 length:228 start_codon:yes stop_codon:yes gene_type:complete